MVRTVKKGQESAVDGASEVCMRMQVMQCPTCDGQGEESTPCNTCGGDGRVRNSKKISLRVPAGAAPRAAAQVP